MRPGVCWLAMCLLACGPHARGPHAPPERFAVTDFAALAGFAGDPLAEALPALQATCAAVSKLADDAPFDIAKVGGTAGEWRPFCTALAATAPGDHDALRTVLTTHLVPVAPPESAQAAGHFTGYYEESLRGSRTRTGPYQTPLHGPPRDLVQLKLADYELGAKTLWGRLDGQRVVPHLSRAEIRAGGLEKSAKVVLWTDEPIAAFFAQIQGSARVTLENGETRIGFAGKNGRPYTAIGREMVKAGLLTTGDVSMQTIRAWLEKNPERAAEVMDWNASYVFFEEQKGAGPRGSSGAVLVPERSLAVDRDVVPLGVPIWVETHIPEGETDTAFRRLMVAQDTGGGIRGTVRGDIFFGAGARAAEVAGKMSRPGRWFLLLPISVAAREMPGR